MGQSRSQKRKQFEKELYVAASFFKMKSLSNGEPAKDGTLLDPTRVEKAVNTTVRKEYRLPPFPHPAAKEQVIPKKEAWEKLGKIARGEAVTIINSRNKDGTQSIPRGPISES